MSRILVISDTHGDCAIAQHVLQAAGKIDLVLHCGDGYDDLPSDLPTVAVRGNCDCTLAVPAERIWQEGAHRLMLTHGHTYGVKRDRQRLLAAALAAQVGLVCFGHTHQSVLQQHQGVWLLNPSSARYGHSYALVQLEGENLQATLCSL